MSRYIDADKILYKDLSEGRGVCWVTFMEWIKEIPTADVRENVRGEWIDDGIHGDWAWETDGHGVCWQIWKCSRCGSGTKIRSNFCPSCGAEMREKEKKL